MRTVLSVGLLTVLLTCLNGKIIIYSDPKPYGYPYYTEVMFGKPFSLMKSSRKPYMSITKGNNEFNFWHQDPISDSELYGNDLDNDEFKPYKNSYNSDTELTGYDSNTWKDNEVSESKMMNPEEKGNYFEGDMMMSQEEVMSLFSISRSGIKMGNRWPIKGTWDKKPEVPYVMHNGYTKPEKSSIVNAMREMESKTCIRFIPRTNQKDYIEFTTGVGCSSFVGRRGGKQSVILERKTRCMSRGTIQHEVMHALGFFHMQSHTDRDNYVKILFENIPGGQRNNNFQKYGSHLINNFDTPYDYTSVMHYPKNAFGKRGKNTIVPHNKKFLNVIGQRNGMSSGDILRINNMYQCQDRGLSVDYI